MQRRVDIGIVTAIEVERDAVVAALSLQEVLRDGEAPRSYYMGAVKTESGTSYTVALLLLRSPGTESASLGAADMMRTLAPRKVIMVGIAGSFEKALSPGDVIVGTHVWYYEHEKIEGRSRWPEPREFPADAELLDCAQNPLRSWDATPFTAPDGVSRTPSRQFGVIACGNKLAASKEFRDHLVEHNRKLAAIEQEGYGIHLACWDRLTPVGVIVIRGISDLADPDTKGSGVTSATKAAWRRIAAQSAASYLLHFLRQDPIARSGSTISNRSGDASHAQMPTQLSLSHLLGRKVVFSTADVHVSRYYSDRCGRPAPLEDQLGTLVILADRTICHCVDPSRLPKLTDLLANYEQFIRAGRICFLMARDITPPYSNTYPAYLNRKRNEYGRSQYGKIDAESLDIVLSDSDHIGRVVDILEMSSLHVIRSRRGTAMFKELVRKDLAPTYAPGFFESLEKDASRVRDLTLWQLLFLRSESAPDHTILPEPNAVVRKCVDVTHGPAFSRQILLSALCDSAAAQLKSQFPTLWGLIERRAYELYLRINADGAAILDFDPDTEWMCPYYFKHFVDHLRVLAGIPVSKKFGPEFVAGLLELPFFTHFADRHFAYASHRSRLPDTVFDANEAMGWSEAIPNASQFKESLRDYLA